MSNDPKVAALLAAVDALVTNELKDVNKTPAAWKALEDARAAFDPPVEMEYGPMPSWDDISKDAGYWIHELTYKEKREATKRPKPKLGREWWGVEYENGEGSFYTSHEIASDELKEVAGRGKLFRVREVLE